MAEEKQDYTKYERARILGSRAMQLNMGAPFLLKFSEKDLEELHYNPLAIARKEFEAGAIPVSVRRKLPHEREQ